MKFSAIKSIFQNCPIKRAQRASRQGNFVKSIFWPKISLKKPQKWPNFGAGPTCLNALYEAPSLVIRAIKSWKEVNCDSKIQVTICLLEEKYSAFECEAIFIFVIDVLGVETGFDKICFKLF